MTLTEGFWIFVVLSALQPGFRQKLLELHRMRTLTRFEKKRESRVIALVHRQETMSLLGFPLMRYIDVHHSEKVLRTIKLTDRDVPLDLLVHTPGGLVLAAAQIAKARRRHQGKVTVFVPHYAMSGGTLIALAADEILRDPNAVLGPVDPQVGASPAASILAGLERKAPNEIDDQTLIWADVARKAISQLEDTVRDLLTARMPGEQAAALAQRLSSRMWTHDYAISAEEAKRLGLPVNTDMPPEVHEFMEVFPQPTRSHPSVEYSPLPHPGRQGLAVG
jgi:ClpP class serine protease